MLAGLETLPTMWTGPRGLPMCSPMSQPSSMSSLLPESSGMSPPMDFSDFLPGTSPSPTMQQQGLPFWELKPQAFLQSGNPWMRGSQAQNQALSFPPDPSNFGGACRSLLTLHFSLPETHNAILCHQHIASFQFNTKSDVS